MEERKLLINYKTISSVLLLTFVFLLCACSSSSSPLSWSFDFKISPLLIDPEFEFCKMTDITGKPEQIALEQYDYSLFDELCNKYHTVFPPALIDGYASYFTFYEAIGGRSYPNRYEIYLEWTMPADTFYSEVDRLNNAFYLGYDGERKLVYSENLFNLPSYVAMYDTCFSSYEYTIIDEQKMTIFYILLYNIGSIEQIVFSKDYAPTKVLKDTDIAKYAKNQGLSIYYPVY